MADIDEDFTEDIPLHKIKYSEKSNLKDFIDENDLCTKSTPDNQRRREENGKEEETEIIGRISTHCHEYNDESARKLIETIVEEGEEEENPEPPDKQRQKGRKNEQLKIHSRKRSNLKLKEQTGGKAEGYLIKQKKTKKELNQPDQKDLRREEIEIHHAKERKAAPRTESQNRNQCRKRNLTQKNRKFNSEHLKYRAIFILEFISICGATDNWDRANITFKIQILNPVQINEEVNLVCQTSRSCEIFGWAQKQSDETWKTITTGNSPFDENKYKASTTRTENFLSVKNFTEADFGSMFRCECGAKVYTQRFTDMIQNSTIIPRVVGYSLKKETGAFILTLNLKDLYTEVQCNFSIQGEELTNVSQMSDRLEYGKLYSANFSSFIECEKIDSCNFEYAMICTSEETEVFSVKNTTRFCQTSPVNDSHADYNSIFICLAISLLCTIIGIIIAVMIVKWRKSKHKSLNQQMTGEEKIPMV